MMPTPLISHVMPPVVRMPVIRVAPAVRVVPSVKVVKFVVFTCQYSAHRAPQCANWYREHAPAWQKVGILSGGFRGWEASGLPVARAITGKGEHPDAKALNAKALQVGQQFARTAVQNPRIRVGNKSVISRDVFIQNSRPPRSLPRVPTGLSKEETAKWFHLHAFHA